MRVLKLAWRNLVVNGSNEHSEDKKQTNTNMPSKVIEPCFNTGHIIYNSKIQEIFFF